MGEYDSSTVTFPVKSDFGSTAPRPAKTASSNFGASIVGLDRD